METKAYTFIVKTKSKSYTQKDTTGHQIKVNSTHPKYEWIQKLEPQKIIKINAKCRWTSSKDYQSIRALIEATSTVSNIPKTDDLLPTEKGLPPSNQSKLGIYSVDVSLYVTDMIQIHKQSIPTSSTPKLAVRSYVELSKLVKMQTLEDGQIAGRYNSHLVDIIQHLINKKIQQVDVALLQKLVGVTATCAEQILKQLLQLRLIHQEFATTVASKDKKWPLLEKLPCTTCKGAGATYTYENQRSGFLNLRQKRVELAHPCEECKHKGYLPKKKYPYGLKKERVPLDVCIDINLDQICVIIIDKFIVEPEFSAEELAKTLRLSNQLDSICEQKLLEIKTWSKSPKYTTTDFPMKVTWQQIEAMSDQMNSYELIIFTDISSIIKLLFKHQILENGTKRRSTKDESIYYKLTKKAKNFYVNAE